MSIFRVGSKDNPLPDAEKYEFSLGDLRSTKKFGSHEDCKKAAIQSAINRLTLALQEAKTLLKDMEK